MALDSDSSSKDFADPINKDAILDSKKDSGNGFDLEKEKVTRPSPPGKGKIGGRIAPVLPHLRGYDFGSDESGDDLLEKQIESEANNAIQNLQLAEDAGVSKFMAACSVGLSRFMAN